MTDKERLVELIKQAKKQTKNANCDIGKIMIFADYLLENGVIVPPVKVGQTVYRIVEMSTGITSKIRAIRKKEISTGIITPCEPTIKRFIRCVTVTKNNFLDCCENYGKTVFLTREEAEKALRGGEK